MFFPKQFFLLSFNHLSHFSKDKLNNLCSAATVQCAPVEESRDNGVKQVHPSTPLSPSHRALKPRTPFPVVQEALKKPPHPLLAG